MKKIAVWAAVVGFLAFAGVGRAEWVRFAVVTDSQGRDTAHPINEATFPKIVQAVAKINPPVQFVVVSGDLVLGTIYREAMAEDFQDWRQEAGPWYRPWRPDVWPWYPTAGQAGGVYVVPGNHDQVDPLHYQQLWQTAFPEMPDNGPVDNKKMAYSFDFGPCHFTVVNTSRPTRKGLHTVDNDWLARDLAATDKPMRFVVGHEPAYPALRHYGQSLDGNPAARDRFWQILAANQVRVYFCGHEHVYDHWMKDGVHQIVGGSAGGAGPMFMFLVVDANASDAIVTAYTMDGRRMIDQFRLSDSNRAGTDNRDRVLPASGDEATGRSEDAVVQPESDSMKAIWVGIVLIVVLGAGWFVVRRRSA